MDVEELREAELGVGEASHITSHGLLTIGKVAGEVQEQTEMALRAILVSLGLLMVARAGPVVGGPEDKRKGATIALTGALPLSSGLQGVVQPLMEILGAEVEVAEGAMWEMAGIREAQAILVTQELLGILDLPEILGLPPIHLQ